MEWKQMEWNGMEWNLIIRSLNRGFESAASGRPSSSAERMHNIVASLDFWCA